MTRISISLVILFLITNCSQPHAMTYEMSIGILMRYRSITFSHSWLISLLSPLSLEETDTSRYRIHKLNFDIPSKAHTFTAALWAKHFINDPSCNDALQPYTYIYCYMLPAFREFLQYHPSYGCLMMTLAKYIEQNPHENHQLNDTIEVDGQIVTTRAFIMSEAMTYKKILVQLSNLPENDLERHYATKNIKDIVRAIENNFGQYTYEIPKNLNRTSRREKARTRTSITNYGISYFERKKQIAMQEGCTQLATIYTQRIDALMHDTLALEINQEIQAIQEKVITINEPKYANHVATSLKMATLATTLQAEQDHYGAYLALDVAHALLLLTEYDDLYIGDTFYYCSNRQKTMDVWGDSLLNSSFNDKFFFNRTLGLTVAELAFHFPRPKDFIEEVAADWSFRITDFLRAVMANAEEEKTFEYTIAALHLLAMKPHILAETSFKFATEIDNAVNYIQFGLSFIEQVQAHNKVNDITELPTDPQCFFLPLHIDINKTTTLPITFDDYGNIWTDHGRIKLSFFGHYALDWISEEAHKAYIFADQLPQELHAFNAMVNDSFAIAHATSTRVNHLREIEEAKRAEAALALEQQKAAEAEASAQQIHATKIQEDSAQATDMQASPPLKSSDTQTTPALHEKESIIKEAKPAFWTNQKKLIAGVLCASPVVGYYLMRWYKMQRPKKDKENDTKITTTSLFADDLDAHKCNSHTVVVTEKNSDNSMPVVWVD